MDSLGEPARASGRRDGAVVSPAGHAELHAPFPQRALRVHGPALSLSVAAVAAPAAGAAGRSTSPRAAAPGAGGSVADPQCDGRRHGLVAGLARADGTDRLSEEARWLGQAARSAPRRP
mgnify:CR=1 FL=1